MHKKEDIRGGTSGAHLKNVSEISSTLSQENAHEWLSAGLANYVLGSLVGLQLTLTVLLRILSSVTLSLLLRFSSLVRGYKRKIQEILGRTLPICRCVALAKNRSRWEG